MSSYGRLSGAVSEKSDYPGSRFRDADGSHQHGGAERSVGSQQRTFDREADPPASRSRDPGDLCGSWIYERAI